MTTAQRIPLRTLRKPRNGQRIIWLHGLAFELGARRYKLRNPEKRVTIYWWHPVVDGMELQAPRYQCWSRKAALRMASLYVRLQHIPQWKTCTHCLIGKIAPKFSWGGWEGDSVVLACTSCKRNHRWQPVEDITATRDYRYETINVTRHPNGTVTEERIRKEPK